MKSCHRLHIIRGCSILAKIIAAALTAVAAVLDALPLQICHATLAVVVVAVVAAIAAFLLPSLISILLLRMAVANAINGRGHL